MKAIFIVRSVLHVLFTLAIFYIVGSKTDLSESIYWHDRYITSSILGGVLGCALGVFLEWIQSYLKVGDFSIGDILLYGLGGLLGTLISSIYPNGLNFICFIIIVVFGVWAVKDIVSKK
jgi:hypothetical protein